MTTLLAYISLGLWVGKGYKVQCCDSIDIIVFFWRTVASDKMDGWSIFSTRDVQRAKPKGIRARLV